jgi:hypothetical protein
VTSDKAISIKRLTIEGTIAGISIAILCISLDYMRLFTPDLNALVDNLRYTLCPLFVLAFTNLVKTMGAVIALTILGNAVLYGTAFGGIAAVVVLVKKTFS